MKVKATKGVKVPFEGQPQRYIEQEIVEVPESLYYRRRIADGDLMVVSDTAVVFNRKTAKSEVQNG